MSKNKCATCGATCDEEKCWKHRPRKPLPKISKKKLIKATKEFKESSPNKMHEFFLSIWNKRPHYSEISNTYLGGEALSIFFHHILPSRKVKEAAFDEENIILLEGDEHSSVESNPTKYPKINELRTKLKTKYNL